jgi:hypothetical protein
MDLWEANSVSTAYTPHPCKQLGFVACTGTDCGDGDNRYGGVCDKDGCDFNVRTPLFPTTCSVLTCPSPTAWESQTSTAPA